MSMRKDPLLQIHINQRELLGISVHKVIKENLIGKWLGNRGSARTRVMGKGDSFNWPIATVSYRNQQSYNIDLLVIATYVFFIVSKQLIDVPQPIFQFCSLQINQLSIDKIKQWIQQGHYITTRYQIRHAITEKDTSFRQMSTRFSNDEEQSITNMRYRNPDLSSKGRVWVRQCEGYDTSSLRDSLSSSVSPSISLISQPPSPSYRRRCVWNFLKILKNNFNFIITQISGQKDVVLKQVSNR